MIARKSEEMKWESRVYTEVSRLLSALPTLVKLPPCPMPALQQEGERLPRTGTASAGHSGAVPGGNSHGHLHLHPPVHPVPFITIYSDFINFI